MNFFLKIGLHKCELFLFVSKFVKIISLVVALLGYSESVKKQNEILKRLSKKSALFHFFLQIKSNYNLLNPLKSTKINRSIYK